MFSFLGSKPAEGQSLEKTIQAFQDHATKNLQEKIYLHIDRSDHITGELLWFKIYCVDGLVHRPLDVSKVVYVEILDKHNQPVIQTKVRLEHGIGSGSVFLPSTIITGSYILRAYTNWMKNYGHEFFFQKQILIVNTLKNNEAASTKIETPAIDVQFFPEGGNLVEGIESRVGFKATDSFGKSIACSGTIVNQLLDTIVHFKSLRFGLGSFLFTPQPKQTYKAIVTYSFGSQTFTLPNAAPKGYTIKLNDEPGNKIKITVSNTDGVRMVQLFIHTRQSIKVCELQSTRESTCVFIVDKDKLGDGISHITIFNEDNQPVCERLYFKKPTDQLMLNVSVDQREYSIRRKVQLTVRSEQPFTGSLSASVFRGDSIASNENILNYFFLSSDLNGRVEYPEFYFSNDPDAEKVADVLMITHGWRRFNWESILDRHKDLVKYQPEANGHIIRGKILNQENNPVSGKIAFLSVPGVKVDLHVARSDSSGNILFFMNDFQGPQKIIGQTNFGSDSLIQVKIDNPFSESFQEWSVNPINLSHLIALDLTKRSLGMQVQDAYYEEETYFNYADRTIDNQAFYGAADEIYELNNFTRFPVLEEVMREFVRGVWVRKKKDEFRFMIVDKVRHDAFKESPLTLLDGVPVFNIKRVLEIDPLKLKKIEVVTQRYFLGPLEFYGIVSLHSNDGDLASLTLDPRSVSIDYEGLQKQRMFYNPRYTNPSLKDSRMPDERHQLYWNPDINLKLSRSSQFDFYTSDVEGNFNVMVEGISNDGFPSYSLTSFRVSR